MLLLFVLSFSYTYFSEANKIAPNLKFHSTQNTLDKIKEIISNKEKGAFIRFGKRELGIAHGKNNPNKNSLEFELVEAISLNDNNYLKSLPIHSMGLQTYEYGIWDTNFNQCIEILKKSKRLWGGDIRDVYSSPALYFTAILNPIELIRLLRLINHHSDKCIFVGNRKIPQSIIKTLFGNNSTFIPAPEKNAYNQIDRIELECLENIPNNNEYKTIIISIGVAGKVLQKRLWEKLDNVFLLDFGSLIDALCGWETRSWIRKRKFNHKQFIDRLKKEVKIVCSAALVDKYFNQRKVDYIESFKRISKLGYEPYIAESCKKGPTFMDAYSRHVYYTNVQNSPNYPKFNRKGIYEALALREGLKRFNFNDDDMIIKLTGRYWLADDYFIKLAEYNIDADAIVRSWIAHGAVFTGCFAMKYKHFKDMLQKLDLKRMEKTGIAVEYLVYEYINNLKKRGGQVIYVDKVHVNAYHFGDGQYYNYKLIRYW